jgi:hypothetical protein
MPVYYCKTREEKQEASGLILASRGGITVTLHKGKQQMRSVKQNRLQRRWMWEAEQQGDQTAEEYRGYCKLTFGVPIMCESEEYLEVYDRIIGPLSYEHKLEMMRLPLDYAVTRLMKTGQKKRYLYDVWMHFTGLGFKLTKPKNYDYEIEGAGGNW